MSGPTDNELDAAIARVKDADDAQDVAQLNLDVAQRSLTTALVTYEAQRAAFESQARPPVDQAQRGVDTASVNAQNATNELDAAKRDAIKLIGQVN